MIPWFEPVIIQLGPVAIHSFGLMVLLALLVGPVLGAVFAWLSGGRGLPLLALPVAAVVLAWPLGRAFYVLRYEPYLLMSDPAYAVALHNGTSSSAVVGAMIPIGVVIAVACGRWASADGVAVAFASSALLIQFGRFLAHDYPGSQATLGITVRGICRVQLGHPGYSCHDLAAYSVIGLGLFLFGAVVLRLLTQPGWVAVAFGPYIAAQHVFIEMMFNKGPMLRLWPAVPLYVIGLLVLGLRLVALFGPENAEDPFPT